MFYFLFLINNNIAVEGGIDYAFNLCQPVNIQPHYVTYGAISRVGRGPTYVYFWDKITFAPKSGRNWPNSQHLKN